MPELSPDNTNALAHRVAGDSLMYECPNCEFGEIPVTALIESTDAACIDCGERYHIYVEAI